MKKSYRRKPLHLDYGYVTAEELPEEIRKRHMKEKRDIIKEAKLTYDGKQFLVRIPVDISSLLQMKRGDMIEFKFTMHPPEQKKKPEFEITFKRG
jgi:hypothetical protein